MREQTKGRSKFSNVTVAAVVFLTRWERVYGLGMADFTREEVVEIAYKLKGADLRGLDLSGVHLARANLEEANLHSANLSRADLSNASLVSAVLNGANLRRAQLFGANLVYTTLYNADLRHANLHKANLTGARYSPRTKWPTGFNALKAGARLVKDEDLPAGPPPIPPPRKEDK